jgi:hypothetical protein
MSIKPKYVLVLCQSKEPIVMGKLIDISKKVLNHKNIILEFMSNPIHGKKNINGKLEFMRIIRKRRSLEGEVR